MKFLVVTQSRIVFHDLFGVFDFCVCVLSDPDHGPDLNLHHIREALDPDQNHPLSKCVGDQDHPPPHHDFRDAVPFHRHQHLSKDDPDQDHHQEHHHMPEGNQDHGVLRHIMECKYSFT